MNKEPIVYQLSEKDAQALRDLIELNAARIAQGEQPIYSRCSGSISNALYGAKQ